MRKDMAKVIVERPRTGGGWRFPRGADRGVDDESDRRRSGIKRPWTERGQFKHLNENLAPLRRYLQSNVGRQWDKVYSEICKHMNVNSAVQLRIWQHLMHFVAVKMHEQRSCGKRSVFHPEHAGSKPFYVDPTTGVLQRDKDYGWSRRWRLSAKPEEPVVIRVAGRAFRRIDGVWHEITLRVIPPDYPPRDALLQLRVSESNAALRRREYGNDSHYVSKVRVLRNEEVKHLMLDVRATN